MIGQNNLEIQLGSRTNTVEKDITSNIANDPAQVSSSQVDVHPLEKKTANNLRCKLDSMITAVETRLHDSILTATEILAILTVEVALKFVNASSGRDVDSAVPDVD